LPCIHSRKVQLDESFATLARIKGRCPEEVKVTLEFLLANVYLAHRPAERGC